MIKIIQNKTTPDFIRPEILLHPNIPKPLHGLNPRSINGNKWWDENRREAYAKNNFCCWSCGVNKKDAKIHQWLEGHEMYKYDFKNYTLTFTEVVALCHMCHNYIHSGRLQYLLDSRQISASQYKQIISHGNKIIKSISKKDENIKLLLKEYDASGYVESWKNWKMIVDGVEYSSKFKTFKDWEDFYNN